MANGRFPAICFFLFPFRKGYKCKSYFLTLLPHVFSKQDMYASTCRAQPLWPSAVLKNLIVNIISY